MNQVEIKTYTKEDFKTREDLGETKKNCDLIQFIILLGYFFTIFIDIHYLEWYLKDNSPVSLSIRGGIGLIFIVISLAIARKALKIIYYEILDPPHMVNEGPFQYTRHPMYLSALLIYLGILIIVLSFLTFLYFIGVIILYRSFAKFEESVLLNEFSNKYYDYMKKVRRWI